MRAFTFDPKRVHAIGFSCGAAYALVLGVWYPDRFATVVPAEPNGSPLVYIDLMRQAAPMVGQPRKMRYFFVGGEDSVGPALERAYDPLFREFYCWEGEVRVFPGGHAWHLNSVENDVMDFMEAHAIDPAEVE